MIISNTRKRNIADEINNRTYKYGVIMQYKGDGMSNTEFSLICEDNKYKIVLRGNTKIRMATFYNTKNKLFDICINSYNELVQYIAHIWIPYLFNGVTEVKVLKPGLKRNTLLVLINDGMEVIHYNVIKQALVRNMIIGENVKLDDKGKLQIQ